MTNLAQKGRPESEPRPFEASGGLPRGMTLLQASAGTGKTFTIAALTTRYVAAGMPIDRLLVITFTRMATGELRERVRDRLVSAFDGLVGYLEGGSVPPDDETVHLLADAPREEVEVRRDRLGKAIADFDAATIETTHGFCLQVLYGLGTAGDVDREVTLVEDVRDVIEEVVDDLYLRRFVHKPELPGFTRDDAMEIARRVLGQPDARIVPALSQRGGRHVHPPPFCQGGAEEMDRRKRALKILTYDDVLIRLRDTLARSERGPGRVRTVAGALRRGAGRRVPGHRPGAVGHHAPGLRRRRGDPGSDRGPQTGDLRLPRRRRPRLSRCAAHRATRSGPWT